MEINFKQRTITNITKQKQINENQSSCLVHQFLLIWTVACQGPLFMGFSRQEYWSGLSFPSPGNLPDPGIEPKSSALQADSLPTEL